MKNGKIQMNNVLPPSDFAGPSSRQSSKKNDAVHNINNCPTQLMYIKTVDTNPAINTNINNVSVKSKLASLLQDFPNIGAVNSSGYSKFAPTHGVEHHIKTNNARPVSRPQPRQAPVWRQK